MSVEAQDLHIVFFPFMAHGHMIPTLDIARLFVTHDKVKATIITTPLNMATFIKANEKSKKIGAPTINIEVFKFPTKEAGLPDGCESPDPSLGPGIIQQFFKATVMLRDQLKQYLEKAQPNCLVADMFFPWATECAAKLKIPRLVFHGTSYFALCAQVIIRQHEPYKNVSSDDEPFILPYLPGKVQMTRLQMPDDLRKGEATEFIKMTDRVKESELESYGVIVNSFYELEPDYADFFRKELGRRAWNIGPVFLRNRSIEDQSQRGRRASIDEHESLEWLNSKKPDSVIYICFGTTTSFMAPQLHEIAICHVLTVFPMRWRSVSHMRQLPMPVSLIDACIIGAALEASGKEFIWVVRNSGNVTNEEWLPPSFEQRIEGRGLIIRGWAPQVLILEHEAIGAFVTHCGWNSTLEGISAGVPMVTWPIFAEQFSNEKLVNQILKIGVPVGVKKWNIMPSIEDIIKRGAIETALRGLMVGKEAEEKRTRAKKLKEMAQKAVEEGGSSYSELSALINELRSHHIQQQD